MAFYSEKRAEQAFLLALELPQGPTPDWSAAIEQVQRTGELPKDDPTYNFPIAVVQSWFEDGRTPICAETAWRAADALFNAHCDLVVKFGFQANTARRSFSRKSKDGPSASLNRALVEIGKASEVIRTRLEQIKWELLYRRMNNERHTSLEALHFELHDAFLYGLSKRVWHNGFEIGLQVSGPNGKGEVGSRASLAPTWLEDALLELADTSVRAVGTVELARIDPARPYAAAVLKSRFVSQVAQIWRSATGAEPSIAGRDDQHANGQLSGFQIFHQHVCGHIAGLAVRSWTPSWPDVSKSERKFVISALHTMGLHPVPSATSLRRYFGKSPEPPQQLGA